MRIFLLFNLFFLGCATQSVLTNVPITPPRAANELVFPYGHYRHNVELLIRKDQRKFSFTSIVETSDKKIQVVMLSPFNTTLMKISENRESGEVKTDVYESRLKEHQERLGLFYSIIRRLLLLERNAKDDGEIKIVKRSSDGPTEIDFRHAPLSAQINLQNYQDHIPEKIAVDNVHFALDVTVEKLP